MLIRRSPVLNGVLMMAENKNEFILRDGETAEQFIFRVCGAKERIGSWNLVADIINGRLGTNYGESAFRKKYTSFTQMFEANRDILTNSVDEIEKIREERRLLEIEKVKFRDERNAWAAQNRVQARAEEKFDSLEHSLANLGRINFLEHDIPAVIGNKTLLVMLSDLHIGATFDNYWGKYNSDIARDRLSQLLEEVKVIAKRHDCNECYVVLGGDIISGSIHHNIQITNRENVIDQIKIASELITSFCYELTTLFKYTTMISVAGNHSRLGRKEECLQDERADDLIAYIISRSLSHIPNFQYMDEANFDNTVAMFTIADKWYFCVHGDCDDFTKSGLQNLITMVHAIPYAVLFAHKHYCSLTEHNNIKMIQSGSLCGTGDDFTVSKRLSGKASQMVCICSEAGIEAYYPIELE